LEKFAINSVISATHSGEMDSDDQKDIINKVKESGNKSNNDEKVNNNDNNSDSDKEVNQDENPTDAVEPEINEKLNLFVNPKKNNMFQPGSNNIEENLDVDKNFSTFVKELIKKNLFETFKQDDIMNLNITEPTIKEPIVLPNEPLVKPSRKNKPFLPMPNPDVNPDPKAKK